MAITAQIIADSINPVGNRITSWVLEYPRFIHSEVMTHRMLSKNSASSRAIPTEKIIQAIINNPAMPVWWGKNQSGMQAKEELENAEPKIRFVDNILPDDPWHPKRIGPMEKPDGTMGQAYALTDLDAAKVTWLESRDLMIKKARELLGLGLHKQIVNRILEPWFHMRIILTGTEFENFFALRAHPDAQPEFQALAYKMLDLYNTSVPKILKAGEWHIPFGDSFDEGKYKDLISNAPNDFMCHGNTYYSNPRDLREMVKIKVAIARCARVSYLNFEGKDDYASDIKLCDRLFGATPRHLSPTEHVAQAQDNDSFIGNFRGFKQYRYTFPDQNLTDSRVKK